jgi:hypothetical protein
VSLSFFFFFFSRVSLLLFFLEPLLLLRLLERSTEKNALFFECFPCVCPEPVLVK